MSLRPHQIMKLGILLRKFGSKCYMYGEETGDYEMKDLDLSILTEFTLKIEEIIDAKY